MTESDVASMKSKYEMAVERNRQLRSEIASLCNSVEQSGNSAINTGNYVLKTLGDGAAVISKDDNTLHDVERVRADIEAKFVLYKNIENAYKNIRGFQEEMRSQQGCEQKVRRMVVSILDNEEKSIVSGETLTLQASKLYQDKIAQEFFLTYIMMDLVHRKDKETEAADRARRRAIEMNERMSAWVYFLIALKREDKAEQSLWLDILMKQSLTGTEKENLKFLTMIALKGEDEIAKKIAKYIGIENIKSIDKTEIAEDILRRYYAVMTVNPPEFKYLKQYVAEYDDLEGALHGAMNNESVGGYLQQVSKADGENIRRGIIGMVLDRVVDDCHSPRAKEILKQIEINQNVITARGNMQEAAALHVKEEIVAVSDLKLENCLYDWLVEGGNYNGKEEIVGFAYGKLKPSYARAYHAYVANYRKKKHEQVSVDLGGYQVKSNLKSASEEAARVEKTFRANCEQQKNAIKDLPSTLMMIFGAILVVAGIILYYALPDGLQTVKTLAVVFGMILGVALIVLGVRKRFRNYRARIDADKKCEEDIVTYTELIQYVVSDMAAYRSLYAEADAQALKDSFFN